MSIVREDKYSVVAEHVVNETQPEVNWFSTKKISDNIYLTTEQHFFEANRCNIWLLKGPSVDIIIDCGLGVCDLRRHLIKEKLIDNYNTKDARDVVCTHVHWDHTGGSHHFSDVSIHEAERTALRCGDARQTLNYVKSSHFSKEPYIGFNARQYKVPPTICSSVKDLDKIDLGDGEFLEVIHLPGHSPGSIALYWSQKNALFSGDVVYKVAKGSDLIDWLPTSNTKEYIQSSDRLLQFLDQKIIDNIYPGHSSVIYIIMDNSQVTDLLTDFIEYHDGSNSICCNKSSPCICGSPSMKTISKLYLSSGLYKYLSWELPF